MVDVKLTITLDKDSRLELVSKLEYIIKRISDGYYFGEDWDIEVKEH